jgi:uncharacterized membrane protein
LSAPRQRLDGIDVLRGIVMILMALDHSRDFCMGFGSNPTDLSTTTPLLFITRWITHFCAPVFVFLAGTSSFIAGQRRSRRELFWFLLSRGLWLVVLEVTVVRFSWLLNVNYELSVFQVIWAIGWSMIVLSFLSLLPPAVVGVLGVVMIASHNLLDGYRASELGPLWRIVHEQGEWMITGHRKIFVAYPLVPWIGVMAAGYGLGSWLPSDRAQRRRLLFRLGAALTLAFIAIRGFDHYGDTSHWGAHPRGPLYTFFSFINCQKYPPSLDYLLMTLGPSLLALAALDREPGPIARRVRVFGQVPLFYYVLHLLMLHVVTIGPALTKSEWRTRLMSDGAPGWGLGATYACWAAAVVLLYPLCRWFAGVKARRRDWWLSYL